MQIACLAGGSSPRAAAYCTFTFTAALLLAGTRSCVFAETVAVLPIVAPEAAFTFTVSVTGPQECAVRSKAVRVQLNCPVPPLAGCVQVPFVVLELT